MAHGASASYEISSRKNANVGIACTSATNCLAVSGNSGTPSRGSDVFSTSDAGSTWSFGSGPAGSGLFDVACPSATECVATGDYRGTGIAVSTDGGSTWSPVTTALTGFPGSNRARLRSVSCASTTSCVAVGSLGSHTPAIIYTTTGPAGTWSLPTTAPSGITDLKAVSCAFGTSTCVAVGGACRRSNSSCGGAPIYKVAYTTDAGKDWSTISPTGVTWHHLWGVSCTSATACVAVGDAGSTKPAILYTTSSLTSWSAGTPPSGQGGLRGISCVAGSTTCYAVGGSDNSSHNGTPFYKIAYTTDGGQTWSTEAGPTGVTWGRLDGIDCTSTSACVAVGTNGSGSTSKLVSIATSDGGSTWSAGTVVFPGADLPGLSRATAVSCTSSADCALVGGSGSSSLAAFTTSDAGSAWSTSSVATGLPGMKDMSCAPGTTDCAAVSWDTGVPESDLAAYSTDGGATWSLATIPSSGIYRLNGVSCVKVAAQVDCVAVGGAGSSSSSAALIYSIDGGATWTLVTTPTGVGGMREVSCIPGTTDCVAVGSSNSSSTAIIFSDTGGQSWVAEPTPTGVGALSGVSCPSTTSCVAVGKGTSSHSTAVATTSDPTAGTTASWSSGSPPSGQQAMARVDCPSTSFCVATGDRYATGIFVSTDGGSTWSTQAFPSGVSSRDNKFANGISCAPGTEDCMAAFGPFVLANYSASTAVPGSQPAPTLSSVSPASGPANGGTDVTLSGTNLENAAYVLFGGKDATGVVDVSPTEVSATTPPGVAGSSVPVQVITPGGTSPSSGAPSFTYSAAPPAYFALSSPTRICDTRAGNPSGLSGGALSNCEGKTLSSGSPLSIQVSGLAGVPSDASAVMANLTVIDPSGPGSLVAYPGGASTPSASTIRFATGSTTAGLTEVGLSSSGAIEVATSVSSAQLAVDVEGYVAPEGSSSGGALYEALSSPSRICDTRAGNPSNLSGEAAQCEGNTLSPNTPLQVQVSGLAGIPSGATAVVVNLTAISPAEGGYLSAYPAGASVPTASNVNFTRGQIVANRAVVTLSSSGAMSLVSDASLNVVVDVSGYFTSSSTVSAGGFHPLADPVRVCDTRPTSATNPCSANAPGPGGVLGVTLGGVSGVPSDASAVVIELSAIDPTSGGYLSVYPAGASRPVVSELNFTPGVDVTNLVIATLPASGAIDVYNFAGTTQVTVDVLGWYQSG